jgi:hypothetical protein
MRRAAADLLAAVIIALCGVLVAADAMSSLLAWMLVYFQDR